MGAADPANPYISEILSQPQAVLNTLHALRQPKVAMRDLANGLRDGTYSRLILTGLGGSHAALNYLLFRLTPHGHCPLLIETSDLVYDAASIINKTTVLIVVSQSGRTAEVVKLLETIQDQPVVAITNDPESPLAKRANHAYITDAGPEQYIISKTYVSALAAMALLAADFTAVGREEEIGALRAAAGSMTEYLVDWREKAVELAERLGGTRSLVFCGRAHSLCSALAGALMARSAARIHAEGVSGSQFRHGHLEMINSGAGVVLYRGQGDTTALQDKLVKEIGQFGGRVVVVGERLASGAGLLPVCSFKAMPLLEILPAQLSAIGLAWHHGVDPGATSLMPKVMAVE
jgi:glucosamine--fructose-6-phosphate aminotransferase (isomerizing)